MFLLLSPLLEQNTHPFQVFRNIYLMFTFYVAHLEVYMNKN